MTIKNAFQFPVFAIFENDFLNDSNCLFVRHGVQLPFLSFCVSQKPVQSVRHKSKMPPPDLVGINFGTALRKAEGLEVVAGFGELEVGDAVAEELLLGEFLDEDDLGGDEDGGLAGCVGNGDFDESAIVVTLVALEAEAAAGHVFADDDVIAALRVADASGIVDLDARVLAAIDAGRFLLLRGRHGEDGHTRLRT